MLDAPTPDRDAQEALKTLAYIAELDQVIAALAEQQAKLRQIQALFAARLAVAGRAARDG